MCIHVHVHKGNVHYRATVCIMYAQYIHEPWEVSLICLNTIRYRIVLGPIISLHCLTRVFSSISVVRCVCVAFVDREFELAVCES